MHVNDVARICHETNRIYCEVLGDFSQTNWGVAPKWQRQSTINGVRFHLSNPMASPSASHNNWLKERRAAGWTYGPVKDEQKKEHPCYMPYDLLPVEQRAKDSLFIGIVHALRDQITADEESCPTCAA